MIKIVFVGKDLAYFNNLKKRFESDFSDEFEFIHLWHDDQETFQRLTIEVVKEMPNICFLDYASNPLKMLTIARSLPRLFDTVPTLIGLWDSLAPKNLLKESLCIGIPFTHIKSAEFGDITNQAVFLSKGGVFPEGNFAKADIMKIPLSLEAQGLMRIGYLSDKYLHVEHDFLPSEKEPFRLSHCLGDDFPIDEFKIMRRVDQNYYYELNHVSDLSYVFVSEKKKEEAKSEQDKKKKFWLENSLAESLAFKKEKLDIFLKNHTSRSLSKRTRLMVIDNELSILRQATKPIDSYPYSIRLYRSVVNRENLLIKILPGILCYQLPDQKDEGELGDILLGIEKLKNHTPFIVVFRSSWSSEHLQDHYKYKNIIAYQEEFDLDLLLNFCKSYEEKSGRMKSHDQSASSRELENRYYIQKDSLESFLSYKFTIEVKAVCEAWMKIQSAEKLTLWSSYHLEVPLKFSFTVIEEMSEPDWARAGFNQYRVVIHGLGERERAHIRVAVNQLIFKENKEDSEESPEDSGSKDPKN